MAWYVLNTILAAQQDAEEIIEFTLKKVNFLTVLVSS